MYILADNLNKSQKVFLQLFFISGSIISGYLIGTNFGGNLIWRMTKFLTKIQTKTQLNRQIPQIKFPPKLVPIRYY